MKKIINTNLVPKVISPYSQAIETDGFVFTAGQIPMDLSGKLIEETIEQQTHQVMKNLMVILNKAGVGFENVVKTTMYITSFDNFDEINNEYRKYFLNNYPVRETVEVKALPKGANLEISMIAVKKL
ncbi:hypothetical protein AUK05_00350 [Candidatus Shapirobacteria bacterium CG2_30_35_20]|uniref:Reactive intermediate/imine deaminase n=1 Tax=Candidatus Shapirobacteria bacterium CG2_30_35_20 TaxID=1805376 RepID=A0A1J5I9B3_9BACT|nr:MAG: hypothetical protein AUK05_00350 [Candidatus Shapirobacteria bacterium CG2_30_35_20]